MTVMTDEQLLELCDLAGDYMENDLVRDAVFRLATVVKLVHVPEPPPPAIDPVLLNLVRKHRPNLIAQQIIGVQPMSMQHYPLTMKQHKWSAQDDE